MLLRKEKEVLSKIFIHKHSYIEKEGVPIDEDGKQVVILTFEQLRDMMYEKICSLGYLIDRVKPSNANVILRVFKIKRQVYGSLVYNGYGAMIYTNSYGKWTTRYSDNSKQIEIEYGNIEILRFICQDEYVNLYMDYCDFYLNINLNHW